MGELVELDLQRGLLVLCLGDGAGDLAHLGLHARRHDHGTATAKDHGGAHVAHVLAIAERNVVLALGKADRVRVLRHGHGLAREGRLLDLHGRALEDAAVRRHGVAGLEDHDVTHDEVLRVDLDLLAVPDDLARGGGHLLERRERLLGLGLLHDAEDGVEDDDEHDDDHVGEVGLALHHARCGRDDRSHDQHDDHGIAHLLEEADPEWGPLGLLELVWAVLPEQLLCDTGTKALLGIGCALLEHVRRAYQVLSHVMSPLGLGRPPAVLSSRLAD